jgi:uncharacterized protein (DUF488 family)
VHVIYTIGYEGTDIDRFVATLKAVGIMTLADVRAIALSRKKGFSKTSLQARLEEEGIGYSHFVELGDPKPGREAARAGQLDAFRRIYTSHLGLAASGAALQSLADLASSQLTCLLCFERDPATCHRSLIANHPTMNGVKVIHLCADDPARYVRNASKLQSQHPRQGAPAA